jgi:threonine aldolase
VLAPFEAVVCTATAHIHTDECGALERFTGAKLIDLPTPDGKLTPELVVPLLTPANGEHNVQPAVIAISQATELGTVYTVEEIRVLADLAHANGLLLFLDGARIANAAAHLGCTLADLTTHAGVDLMTFGGTKNGLLYGEALVVLNPAPARHARFARKQYGQLASKMRFISAQFSALLTGDLWLHNARHANAMATRLATALADVAEVGVLHPPAANSVFAVLPAEVIAPLQEWAPFLTWGPEPGLVRWMTSFSTTESDVDRFVAGVRYQVEAAYSPR